jgi:hypothetical protein
LQTAADKQPRDRRENTFKVYPIWEWTADEYERKPVSTKSVIAIITSAGVGVLNVRFILGLLVGGGLLVASVNTAVSQIAPRVSLYALAGTLVGAVASGMLLWVLLLL